MNAPCKGCLDRHDICWQECERYAEYKAEQQEIKKKIAFDRAQVGLENRRARRGKIIAEWRKKYKENA